MIYNNLHTTMESSSVHNSMAQKEIELLNFAIARQEEIGLKIRGWCITLITALTLAFLSQELNMNAESFLAIGFFITVLFFYIEILHRVAEIRAIRRSEEVESMIRDKRYYDGPKIAFSLTKKTENEISKAVYNSRIYWTYLFLLLFNFTVFALNTEFNICFS